MCDGVDGPEDGAEPAPDGGAGGGCEGLEVIDACLRVGVDCCWDCGPVIISNILEFKLKFLIILH